jgi:hypothetical protein
MHNATMPFWRDDRPSRRNCPPRNGSWFFEG